MRSSWQSLNCPELIFVKSTQQNNLNYRQLYIEDSRSTVYNIYQEDIKKYNYKF